MQPGPCVFVREVIECRNAMSSTCRAIPGSIEEIIFPLAPAARNGQGDRIGDCVERAFGHDTQAPGLLAAGGQLDVVNYNREGQHYQRYSHHFRC